MKDVKIYHLTQSIPRQSEQNFSPDNSSSDSSALAWSFKWWKIL